MQEWFTTLFACNLHVEAALATITMILLRVDNSLFRVGAAILDLLRVELVQLSQEGLMTVRCCALCQCTVASDPSPCVCVCFCAAI